MKVRFSKASRDIYLPRGQALFEVEHDAQRPFRVHTDTSIVEAVGTQFDVRVFDHKTIVSVVEGTVRVITPKIEGLAEGTIQMSAPARLQAGEGATVDAEGDVKLTPKVNVAAVSAWKQQRLIFTGESLKWIADEFNRYNRAPRLTIEGEALQSRRFSGVFNAHSPESLLEYLQQDPSIVFERRNDEIVIREATP
jgi:transmembrane sensor